MSAALLRRIQRAEAKRKTAVGNAKGATTERDTMIRQALDQGIGVRDLVSVTGLSYRRINQIRNGA